MKKLAPKPLALHYSHARWGLAVALALVTAQPVHAQTLVDTAATVGLTNTLAQQGTSADMSALQRANALKAKLQGQQAQAPQQVMQAPAPAPADNSGSIGGIGTVGVSSGTPAPAAPVVTLTPEQQALLVQAQQLLSQNRLKQAQTAFEAVIAQNYRHPDAHFGLGLAMFAQNNLKGAKFEFAQYATLAPTSFEGAYNLGVIAVRQGDYNEALKQFTDAASKSAQASSVARRLVLDALASEQLRRNDYAALVATLTQAQAIDPSDAQLQLRLGQAMTLIGQGTAALPLLYAAAQNATYRADAVGLIADIYLAQNLPDRALSSLNTAIAQASSDTERADLLVRKAQLQDRLNQKPMAVNTTREAIQLDSRSASAQALLGQLLSEQNDRVGSVDAWEKAVKLDSKNATYGLQLAAAYLSASQPKEALQSATTARKISSDNATKARASFLQGVASYRLHDYRSALNSLKDSSTLVPAADTSLWLGLSSYALKNYPAAIAAFTDSIKLQDTPAARLNLGAAYLASGMFKEAEPLLQSAVKLDNTNAQAWYQLGLARRALGNTAEARASFRMAAQLGYAAANAELK